MPLVFIFGAPGRHRKHLKLAKLDFYWLRKFSQNFWASRPGGPKIPGELSWPVKVQFCGFQMIPMSFRSPKSKKNSIFMISGSSLIGRWQNPRIYYSKKVWPLTAWVTPINTGCYSISVLFKTPLFFNMSLLFRMPFYVLNKQCGGLISWKKNLTFLILSGSRPGTSSAWFSG